MKVKTQVLDPILSVTLQGAGAARQSLRPPQPRDKVQKLPGRSLHIRAHPGAPGHGPTAPARDSAQPPSAPVPPGQREHSPHHTQKQGVLLRSEHFAGASHGQSNLTALRLAPWDPCTATPLFLVLAALGTHLKHMDAAYVGQG